MQQMIDELKALPTKPVIYLCTPVRVDGTKRKKDDNKIRDSIITTDIIPVINKVAKKNNLRIIDLNPVVDPASDMMQRDGVHPTEKGAKRMAEVIAESIRKEHK